MTMDEKQPLSKFEIAFAILIALFTLGFAAIIVIFSDWLVSSEDIFEGHFCNEPRGELEILVLVIFPLIFAGLSFSRKWKVARTVIFAVSTIYAIVRLCVLKMAFSRHLLLGAVRLFGSNETFRELSENPLSIESAPVGTATVILFAVVLLAELFVLLPEFGKNKLKHLKKAQKGLSIALIFTAAVFLVFALTSIIAERAGKNKAPDNLRYSSGFCIFESDTGSDLTDFDLNKPSKDFEFDWELFREVPDVWEMTSETHWEETGVKDVYKKIFAESGSYSPKKRYVLLLPYYDHSKHINQTEWAVIVDTEEESELKATLDCGTRL